MKKYKNLNKILNYKILSTLPLMGICLITHKQMSNAMFRSTLRTLPKALQPSTTGNPSIKTTYLHKTPSSTPSPTIYRSGDKVSIVDSSSLNSKHTLSSTPIAQTTSTSTSNTKTSSTKSTSSKSSTASSTIYRSGTRFSIFDSNPLKNTNPNSYFSTKSSSANPPTASTNIYRNSRTLSVLGNDIFQNNNGNYTPLNLTSKLTPYSPTNTQQQPVSNKPSISNIKSTTSPTSSITSNPDYSLELSETGKKLGTLLGNALKPILELSARTTFYNIKNNSNDISSLINSNKSYRNESSKWGNMLSTALVARLQVDAINNNQNSTTLSKK